MLYIIIKCCILLRKKREMAPEKEIAITQEQKY